MGLHGKRMGSAALGLNAVATASGALAGTVASGWLAGAPKKPVLRLFVQSW